MRVILIGVLLKIKTESKWVIGIILKIVRKITVKTHRGKKKKRNDKKIELMEIENKKNREYKQN